MRGMMRSETRIGDIRVLGQNVERLDAIGGDQHLIAMIAEMLCDGFAQGIFILDHQDQAWSGKDRLRHDSLRGWQRVPGSVEDRW